MLVLSQLLTDTRAVRLAAAALTRIMHLGQATKAMLASCLGGADWLSPVCGERAVVTATQPATSPKGLPQVFSDYACPPSGSSGSALPSALTIRRSSWSTQQCVFLAASLVLRRSVECWGRDSCSLTY